MPQDMALRYRDPWLVPKIMLGVVAAIIALIFLPSILLASIIVLVARKLLTRAQWGVLLLASIVSICLTAGKSFSSYFHWLFSVLGLGDFLTGFTNTTLTTPLWLPPLAVVVFGLAVASLVGIVLGNDGAISSVTPMKPSMGNGLVPKDRERIRSKLIQLSPPRDYIPDADRDPKEIKGPKQDPKNRRIPMGRDQNRKLVWLSESEMKTHGVILGSTGSGKTEAIKWLAGSLMDMEYSGVIVDLKEDLEPGGLRDFCRAYTRAHGIPYQEVALSDMDGYWYLNALAGMTADQAFDAAVASETFDDSYHQALTKKGAGQMNKLLFHAHELFPDRYPAPSLYSLGDALQHDMYKAAKPMLADVSSRIGQDDARNLYSSLFTPDKTLKEEAQGFGLRLTNLYDSYAGRNVLMAGQGPDGKPRRAIDFTQSGLIYIGASSTGYKELAKTVSSSVLARINALAASVSAGLLSREDMGNRFLIVDEANFIERQLVKNFLSRARSSGFRGFFSTQSSMDWSDPVNGDDWPAISQNVNVAILGKMNDPESAEAAAKYVGTQEVATASRRITDGVVEESGTLSNDEEFLVKPEEFRSFREGEMIIRTPIQKHWCQVPMRAWELKGFAADGSPRPVPEE